MEPWRHQVAELPAIAVREPSIGCTVFAAGVRHRRLGRAARAAAVGIRPRLQAAVVTLAVRHRLSRRDTTELARELFGVELATGSVDAIVQRTEAQRARGTPAPRLKGEQIKWASRWSTSTRPAGRPPAATGRWAALTARTAVFRIAAGRHAFEARTLLGERFTGIVCSDRWRGYDYLVPTRRQLCWAHLLRDFTAHSEGMAEQKTFGDQGLRIARELFAAWASYQARRRPGPAASADRADSNKSSASSSRRGPEKLEDEVPPPVRQDLLNRWPALWTFTDTDGVEPTNNHAERGLRGAVIYRKLSLGSQ